MQNIASNIAAQAIKKKNLGDPPPFAFFLGPGAINTKKLPPFKQKKKTRKRGEAQRQMSYQQIVP